MKIVFMGTPEFAVPSLNLLYHSEIIDVIAVITQPDRPSGRGHKLTPSPVKTFALENDIPVFQPVKIRNDPETINLLKHSNADAFVTVAFGQILSKEILDIPPLGTINLHASLLPKYRGPNPIQWAIISGETTTGLTTMLTEEGVDCGDILIATEIPILMDYDAAHLTKTMSNLGSRLIVDTLLGLYEGSIAPTKQDHTQATHAPKLKKDTGKIQWGLTTWKIHNLIRGTLPWPGAYTYYNDQLIKIHSSYIPCLSEEKKEHEAGTIKAFSKSALQVFTGDGYIDIIDVQPPNKPVIKAVDWARGARVSVGERFHS